MTESESPTGQVIKMARRASSLQARVQPALKELQTQNEALNSKIDAYKEKIKGLQRQILIGAEKQVEKPKTQVRKKQVGMIN